MSNASTLIRGGMVLTLDRHDRLLERADILVEGETISFVGDGHAGIADRADLIVEAGGLLVAPGLINAHMHSQSGTMSGFGDRLSHPAFMWLTQAHTSNRTPEEIRLATLLCAAQMLATGTTAAIDHFPGQRFTRGDMDAVLAAWEESGMRVALAMRFFDGDFGDIVPAGAGLTPELAASIGSADILKPQPLAELRELMPEVVADWHGRGGRLQVFPAPSNPDRCSDAALHFSADLAERHDLGIHTHLLETKAQARIARDRYGTTTVRHLEDLGILSDRWSCAHSIWLDDDDIALMAERRAVAVHNPESNARIGAGRMRTPEMLAAGVPVALGTDGSGANDNLVMHEAMRAAALLHRADLDDRRNWVSARDALRMGTEGGARALRLADRLGRIAPGQFADLVLYRLDAPWWRPVNNPVAQLVFAETGAAVEHVFVHGRQVVAKGRVTAFDAEAVMSQIADMTASLRRRNRQLFAAAEAIARALP